MGIYLVLLASIIIVAFLLNTVSGNENKKLKKIIFLIFVFIILFAVMGLRDRKVGVDTKLYCNIFKGFVTGQVNNNNFDTSQIYRYYNIIVGKLLGTDSRNIILANSFIIVLLFCIFINKTSPNIYISTILYILLYFYLQGFNIARQMIATFLSALAINYAVNRDWKKYVVLSLIAIFIHNTAIIIAFVGLMFIIIKNYDYKKMMYLCVGAILSSLVLERLINLFISIFPKYASYVSTNDYEYGSGRKILIIFVYAIFLVIGLYAINRKKRDMEPEKYRKYMIYSSIVLLACVLGSLGSKSILIGRISLYFEIFMIVYIPMVVDLIERRKSLWYFFIILILFIPFYVQLSGNISGVVPYKLYN